MIYALHLTLNISILTDIFTHFFNITDTCIQWFKSYLIDRTQQIKINKSLSKHFDRKYGAPQGSCIGPKAFLAYISHLYKIIKYYIPEIEAYADNNQLKI